MDLRIPEYFKAELLTWNKQRNDYDQNIKHR